MIRLSRLSAILAASIFALLASAMAQPTEAPKAEAAAAEATTLMPKAKIKTTLGDIVIELNGEKAPISTLNFIKYAKSGYYNGTIFHRVMDSFMIQGGGYTADLKEKAAGRMAPIKNEWKNGLKNNRGTIAMARLGGQADSATSQFFINVVDNPALDQPNDGSAYAVFGKVVEGLDVVDKIRNTPTKIDQRLPMGKVVPETTVTIESVEILDSVDEKALEAKATEAKASVSAEPKNVQPSGAGNVDDLIKQLEADTGKKAQSFPSGLKMITVREGQGESPQPTDNVEVHYEGKLVTGTVFDSSYKRNAPSRFRLNQVIKGWTEGLGYMKPGGESILIIPGNLAYGAQGRPGTIPPNATLVFKVELLSIVK